MKRVIFSLCSLFLISNSAYAACQWDYLNQLNKDIKHAQDLLSDYSTCRNNCKALETGLNRSLIKMSKTSACGTHILTTSNVETINFIGGRFKLIQKQKTASTWASGGSIKPTVQMAPPQTASQETLIPVPEPAKVALKQTRMMISKDAYNELWDVNKTVEIRQAVQQRTNQQKQVDLRARQQQENLKARKHYIAQQRLDKHLKTVLVRQEKNRLVKAKRRAIQDRLHKQRLIRQQFLKKRALAIRVNQQKARQQRLARIQKSLRR